MGNIYLVFLTLMCCGLASQASRDLSGKVFTFPEKGNTAHVRLAPLMSKILFSVTVCLRFYSDVRKNDFVLFSMDVPTQSNSFTLFRQYADNDYYLYVSGEYGAYHELPFNTNQWNSICATWDAGTGLSQVTVNNVHSVKTARHVGASIAGAPIIMLGQDQDSYGGGFEATQAFNGHIKDVHMWDHVISACEVKSYMQGLAHSSGNYLDWTRMEYSIHGYVLVEDYATC
ncbi:hypothetical protein ACEWY4_005476 [Coilia grayii]|uniref:Pentraxin family member n=1 Tax=Coilia grayii TaxID=363190 RepID=A0ABD1KIF3_9TELE